jgi:hypothetical protein
VRLEHGKYPRYGRIGIVDGVRVRPRLEEVLRDQLHITDATLEELEHLRRDFETAERANAFLGRMLIMYHDLLLRYLDAILLQALAARFPSGVVSQHMYQTAIRRELEK